MGVSDKVIEALRSVIVLNDRVDAFSKKVDRLDQDVRMINDRLIRVETIIEMARGTPGTKRIKS